MKNRITAFLLSAALCLIGLFNTPLVSNAASNDASIVVNLALSKVGTNYADGYCLAFVKDMFKQAYGFNSTACCAYKYGSSYIDSTNRNNIPLGASVFFGESSKVCGTCGNRCGHIGIYVGDDCIVHGWAGTIRKYKIDRVINAGYPYRDWGWHNNYALTGGTANGDIESFYGTFTVMCSSKSVRSESNGSSTTTRTVKQGDNVKVVGYVYNEYGNLWYKTDKGDYIHPTYLQAQADTCDTLPPTDYKSAVLEVKTDSKTVKSDPYGSAETMRTVSRGSRINIVGYVYNQYGNLWYETDDGYYIYCHYLSVISSDSRMPSNYLETNMKVKASSKTLFADPYSSSDAVGTVTKDSNVAIRGYLYNRYGNLWYMTSSETYVYSNYLEQTTANSSIPSNYAYRTFTTTAEKARNSEPYAAAQESESIAAGKTINTIGYMINLYGNKWYECEDGWFIYDSSLSCVHSWNTGAVTTAATCTTTGVKTFTCTLCGAKRTESITATGHSYGSWTKLNDTQHQRVCSKNSAHMEKANHTWDSGVITKEPTTTVEGVKTFTCTTCGATRTEPVDKLESTAIPGDINGDGTTNNKDLTRLMKYLAGEDVSVIETVLDVNGDGVLNNKDLTRLMKYLAGEDVELN